MKTWIVNSQFFMRKAFFQTHAKKHHNTNDCFVFHHTIGCVVSVVAGRVFPCWSYTSFIGGTGQLEWPPLIYVPVKASSKSYSKITVQSFVDFAGLDLSSFVLFDLASFYFIWPLLVIQDHLNPCPPPSVFNASSAQPNQVDVDNNVGNAGYNGI